MQRKLVHALAAVAMFGLAVPAGHAQNQIRNWEFDEPLVIGAGNHWFLWQTANFTDLSIVEDAGLSGRYAMKVDIAPGAASPLQVIQSHLKLEQGVTYTISFMAKADAPRTVTVRLQGRTLYNWQVFWVQGNIQLTTPPQTFTFEYTHTGPTVGGTGDFNSDIDWYFDHGSDDTDAYYDRIWLGPGTPPPTSPEELARAYNPIPDDGVADVPRDTMLRWTAGEYAVAHDVYLGTSMTDVETADRDNPGSALVSQGQSATEYDPDGLLEFSTTYYWKINEVNGPPEATIFTGDIWQFTTETYSNPIANVTATASSAGTSTGPQNTVNGSGLNAAGEHSDALNEMWLTAPGTALPAWIQFAFDQPYELHQMKVWNSNQMIESFIGFGAKDVTLEYSLDGTEWTVFGDFQLEQAPGTTTYTGGAQVDLSGVVARYVRLTIQSNWAGSTGPVGLSEIRFWYIPVHARLPEPAHGAENVAVDTTLSWREGRRAGAHTLYLGTDMDAVSSGTVAPITLNERRYSPDSLEYGQAYFWRVDEVNEATDDLWPGATWYFRTAEYTVIDDFEQYTNDSPDRVFQTWVDGLGFSADDFFPQDNPGNGTGAIVGYDPIQGDIMERTIVHGGNQSMPVSYNNTAGPFRSEAQRTWTTPQDWTANGADRLTLFFRGEMINDLSPLYIVIEDSAGKTARAEHSDPNAVRATGWTEWSVSWDELAGVNMAKVKMMAIGIGSQSGSQGRGAGMIFIDDIRVGRPSTPIGLVAHYALENDATDSSGNGHDGTVVGTPVYIAGPAGLGTGLEFDGTGGQYVDLGTLDPSLMTGRLSVSLWAKWNGLTTFWQGLIGKRDSWARDNMMWQIEANQTTGVLNFQREGAGIGAEALPQGEWAHVAATFDGTTAKLYINGEVKGQGTFSFGSDPTAAMQFGSSNAGGGNPFNGALDEVRLYDTALSDAGILTLAGK